MRLFELKPALDGFRPPTTHETYKAALYAKKHGFSFGSCRVNDKSGDIHLSGPGPRGENIYCVLKA